MILFYHFLVIHDWKGRYIKVIWKYLLILILLSFPAQAQTVPNPTTVPRPITGSPAVPATIAGSATWTSACQTIPGYARYLFFAGMSGAGTIVTRRYADVNCTQPVDPSPGTVPASPLALASSATCPSAGYCGSVSSSDFKPFIGLTVSITDTSGSTNTVRAVSLLTGVQ